MESVTVSREFAAPPDKVRAYVWDVGPFMRAGGFDEVRVHQEDTGESRPAAGDRFDLTNSVGIATIELSLELFDDDDAVLAYRQRDGIFEEMVTRYHLTSTATGSELSATTEFAIDVALVGKLMDATIIKRQRRRELEAQFDWLETELEASGDTNGS